MSTDPTTPFLGLIKPLVNDEPGEDLWGDKLNGNFDKLDTGIHTNSTAIATLQTTSITDAPLDGKPYGRKDGAWRDISTLPVGWDAVTGKPDVFPPELPIPQTGVTGLITDQAAQDANIGTRVLKAGDTMSGPLVLPGNPTAPSQAANKAYVDAQVGGAAGNAYTKVEADARFEPIIVAGATNQYWRGNKTWAVLDKSAVGLGNVDNTSDASKPISTATASGLALKEDKANRAIANGYASLGSDGKVPAGQLPPQAPFPEAPTTGAIYGRRGSDASWQMVTGVTISDTPPAGARAGDLWWESDSGLLYVFFVDPGGPPGQWVVTNPIQDGTKFVAKTGDTMTGNLILSKSNPIVSLDAADATASAGALWFNRQAKNRWAVFSYGTESSGNLGSDFYIARYNDAGTQIDNALAINRANATATFAGTVYANGSVVSYTGALVTQQPAAGGNAHVIFQNSAGAVQGYLYWHNTTGNMVIQNAAGNPWTFGANNNLICPGQVYANQNFVATTVAAVLAATGAGTVYLRPNGEASGTGQVYVQSNGVMITSNSIQAGNGVYTSPGTVQLTAPSTNVVQLVTNGVARVQVQGNGGVALVSPGAVGAHTQTNYGGTPSVAGMLAYSADTNYYAMLGFHNVSVAYAVYGNGGASMSNGSWAGSDARFKEMRGAQFSDAVKALDVVDAIPVRAFNLIGPWADTSPNGTEQFGFIAQEIEKVLPLAVVDIPPPRTDLKVRAWLAQQAIPEVDTDAAKTLAERTDLTAKSFNSDYLIATLWAAVQELRAEVNALKGTP